MKEKDKLNLLTLLRRHVFYKDGFFLLQKNDDEVKIASELEVREFIRAQMQPILEKDVTDCISELCYNTTDKFNIESHMLDRIEELASQATGESMYFASLDRFYPKNKFRQIMNYYLFSPDCYCFILVGYGQTGKTTFVDIISKILGEEYCGRSNVSLLKDSHGTAVLEGKLLYEVAEAQDLDLDTANQLKSIITGNTIYVNPKFQLPRTFRPHCKLIMTCNNSPRFKVTDDGIIRRFITVTMNTKLPQDRKFLSKIEADIPNIVAEALRSPFHIEDFAEEQYAFFLNDAQFGFGFGVRYDDYDGNSEYEKYKNMCRACGYMPRNKANFEKFVELAEIYKERCLGRCGTILKEPMHSSGATLLRPYEGDDLPF